MSTLPPEPSPYGPVTGDMVAYLRATGPWVRFLSIMALVGAVFFAFVAVLVMILGPAILGQKELESSGPGAAFTGVLLGVVYLAMAFVYLVWAWFMHRFASAISRMKHAPDVPSLTRSMEDALDYQRRFWRLMGIVGVISIVFVVGTFLLAIVVGFVGALAS